MVDIRKIERDFRYINLKLKIKGREILKDYDITVTQFLALYKIINNNGISIGELSKEMALACSTVTELINRMIMLKLVRKEKDEKDKRVNRIYSEERAEIILENVLNRRANYIGVLLKKAEIDPHDIEYILETMRNCIDESDGE